MGVLDDLDKFCGYSLSGDSPYRFTQFWRTKGNCLRAWSSGGEGSGLSSNNVTCHDYVDLSVCFEDTAILIGICVIFWLLAGLMFLVTTCTPVTRPLPFSRLHASKLLLVVLLMATGLCDLGYTVYQEISGDYGGIAQYLYFSPGTIVVTAVIGLLVLWQERRDGVRSSALFTILWFSLSCYAILKLRSLILLAEDQHGVEDEFRFTTFCVQFGLYLLQLVLVLLPEPLPKGQLRDPAAKKPCPEESATFLSRITWWWLNGLIWRGWRKDLEYSDLTDLNPQDKSAVVAGNFQKSWESEVHRTQKPVAGGGRRKGYQPVSIQDDNEASVDSSPRQPTSEGDTVVRVVPSSRQRRREAEPSLVLALLKSFWPVLLASAFFKLVQDLLNFVSPQVLKLLITFTEDRDEPDWKGYFYAALLFVTAVVQSLFLHQYFHRCFTLGMRMRSAIVAAIYKKALCLNNKSRREKTVGEIVNLMSVDAQRFMDLMTYFHLIWSAPLQIVLALLFLYFTMGVSIFAGFALMILMIPFNAAIAAKSRKYQVKQMAHKDSRIKLVNEILNGIKVIKLYAWEIPFQGQVQDIRQKELDVLKASAYLNAAASFTWTCAPFLVSLVTFGTFTLININNPENQLTPDKAFVALSLFNILRFPLAMLPMLISNFVQASVSVKRVGAFLRSEELDPDIVDWSAQPATDKEYAVEVTNGTFTWSSPEGGEDEEGGENRETGAPTLSDINLRIGGGQLVAVVGQVGAGKSSIISALLGEMDKLNGTVSLKGQVAYVPQQAWIQNATIQNNILFGQPMQGLKYSETLHSCALEPDLEILPGGDQTEIGEKGINLSGGQKQRVSLARAVYQEADVYLLDDPLSAVDSHVGKHIFEKVIGPEGMIRNKTRILVTHGINYLPQCDQIVVMNGGRISEIGSYGELIDADGAFAEFIRVYSGVGEEDGEDAPSVSEYTEYCEENLNLEQSDSHGALDPSVFSDDPETRSRRRAHGQHLEKKRISESSTRDKKERKRHVSKSELKRQLSRQMSSEVGEKKASAEHTDKSTLIKQEKVETGSVHMSVLFAYVRACTYPLSLLTILFYLLTNGASLASNFWLADWSNSNIPENRNQTVTACDSLNSLAQRSGCYLGVYGALGIIQSFLILFAAFSLALSAIFASRTLHNSMLKNILRSPMSFFDTTPLGRILNRFSKDTYIIDEVIPRSLRSFIFTFLSVMATLIVIVVTTPPFLVIIVPLLILYAIIQRFYVATSRQLKRLESTTRSPIYSHFQESVMGVSSIRAYRVQQRFVLQSEEQVDYNQLAYYPSICSNRWLAIRLEFMGNLIILFAALFVVIQRNYQEEIKIRINAGLVGLSISYALQVTQSLNWVVRMTSEMETNIVAVERVKEYAETPQEAVAVIPSNRPTPEWPADGHVRFDHYSTRYREGLNLVLRDVTIDIPGGTKVGIVGRTGAGKSSLTLALFRIIEAATGSIRIDNVPISSYGLSDVRSRLTIIPQDPVLFSGSLRMNLDPFDKYGDTELWKALESAGLKSFVTSVPGGLQYMISEGGENLSVGQRQLVCLARALLRKTKVLVLDEATAAVDLETDDLIQKTIRSEFADCTILTIAHRLNTIVDYDYVMLLDAGRIVEYNPPAQLLGDKKSSFYAMAKDANLV